MSDISQEEFKKIILSHGRVPNEELRSILNLAIATHRRYDVQHQGSGLAPSCLLIALIYELLIRRYACGELEIHPPPEEVAQ